MEQNWEDILFLHWPIEERVLQPRLPAGLDIDNYDDIAWIGITPFHLSGLRLHGLPELPGLHAFNEINVRTYVHHEGTPGVLFLSLDASKLIPALAARIFFGLPYHDAEIEFDEVEEGFGFEMRRAADPSTTFRAEWRPGGRLAAPDVESLEFFLVERYCLFTESAGRLSMTRIHHHPWLLREATVSSCHSTLLAPLGLAEPDGAPLAHFSEGVQAQVWAPEEV